MNFEKISRVKRYMDEIKEINKSINALEQKRIDKITDMQIYISEIDKISSYVKKEYYQLI